MTARDEILTAARQLASRSADGTFTPDDIVRYLSSQGSPYVESTIRTHVTSRMCIDAPDNHARTYNDLIRVANGRYRLR